VLDVVRDLSVNKMGARVDDVVDAVVELLPRGSGRDKRRDRAREAIDGCRATGLIVQGVHGLSVGAAGFIELAGDVL
jgi:hypothetical protein